MKVTNKIQAIEVTMSNYGLFKDLWGHYIWFIDLCSTKNVKKVDFWKNTRKSAQNCHTKTWKIYRYEQGKLFLLSLVYYDSLYYNESFLLVNLIFKAKPPIVGYPHLANVWIHAIFSHSAAKAFFKKMKLTNKI